uniref:Uncharacterized protein n=1 Tax=Astatotilapia calliptera TaxID=8154 RepID=A0AAX7UMF9_ASTCA
PLKLRTLRLQTLNWDTAIHTFWFVQLVCRVIVSPEKFPLCFFLFPLCFVCFCSVFLFAAVFFLQRFSFCKCFLFAAFFFLQRLSFCRCFLKLQCSVFLEIAVQCFSFCCVFLIAAFFFLQRFSFCSVFLFPSVFLFAAFFFLQHFSFCSVFLFAAFFFLQRFSFCSVFLFAAFFFLQLFSEVAVRLASQGHRMFLSLCTEAGTFPEFFQQDGAPPHYGCQVRAFLDEQFPGKWIGRRGPVEWPPRSPDLTPLDFYL